MKSALKLIWVLLFGVLVFIVYKAYKYLSESFADDAAKAATDDLKSFSIKDWFLTWLGFDTKNGSVSFGTWLGGLIDGLFGGSKSGDDGSFWDKIKGWFGSDDSASTGKSAINYKYNGDGKIII